MSINNCVDKVCIEDVSVAILLASYNGGEYLDEQLKSIANQSFSNFTLYISDDGSTDSTLLIIEKFISDNKNIPVFFIKGPGVGFAQNFMWLLQEAEAMFDYYAFCDQDDIWAHDKLEVALRTLETKGCNEWAPAMYGGRTELVDESGGFIGYSPLFKKKPSFSNALVQNVSGGNTMVINKKSRDLLLTVHDHSLVVSHDWLAYLFVTSVGGIAIYDPNPRLKYRQHGGNLVGSNMGWKARIYRLWDVFAHKRLHYWSRNNIECLSYIEDKMTPESLVVLRSFKTLHSGGFFERIINLIRIKVYRQTLLETVTLYVAAIFRRI